MEFSKEEILKLDEVLKFLNNLKDCEYDNQYLAKHFEISLEQFEFLYNQICNLSTNEFNIGNILDKGSHYQKIWCDYHTDRFIENGGFKEYYKLKKERELEIKNITNNFNNSTIGQFNQSDDLSVVKTEIKKIIQPKEKEKQQNAIAESIGRWFWQIVIPLLIGVVLLAIQQKWFT
ncbi:hypothetical protein ACFX5E_02025 [Flavobacterium sp. LS2P90]|uniref:Uncharacterized protein n=1 Tax=Flavobacterium xylosi TaxID=3230415 RepID=A0ABW6HTE1_9FLAO